jgi:hypothetical protein
VGVETEYRLLASEVPPMAMIKGALLPGQTLRLIAQAVNGNRQGKASEPVEFTMPLVEANETSKAVAPAVTLPAVPAVELPATATENGAANGHANGSDHTNGSRIAARV